jgi:hypothetical protein
MDTMAVARGVEALANGEGRERVKLDFNLKSHNEHIGYFSDRITR